MWMLNVACAIGGFLFGVVLVAAVWVWSDKGIRQALNSERDIARYPSCEHLNMALDALLGNHDDEDAQFAIEEICNAINKAGGYYTNRVANLLSMYGFGGYVAKERAV